MSSTLTSVGLRQSGALEEFRSSEEAGLLARLAQTECLLEIAKLASQRTDLSSFAGTVVGIVTQFVSCASCTLAVDIDDIPPITVSYGDLDSIRPGASRHSLHVDGRDAGSLVVVPEVPIAGSREFLADVAEQVSGGLGALVDAERLRRSAAVAQTLHLVDALGEQMSADALAELAAALALLPHALGARLDVDHTSLAGAVSVAAGAAPLERGEPVHVPGGTFTLSMRWSATAAAGDAPSPADLETLIAAALARAEEQRELRDAAETDPLTGVANRRRALRALAEAVGHAERVDDTVGFIYLDLDHFKRVNDELGHDVGDEVLVAFARHLQSAVRERDTVARFGGEEFVVVCPGLGDRTGDALVRRIIETTPAACAVALPGGWRQSTSAGLACYPNAAGNPDALVRAADKALYEAKGAGRNQFRTASELA
ncbi:MAG: GGDEF domain-containing protein [Actinomycetota bacterium]|nr:GGDEF domain-containing protein [Actinomycetota bacterium]